MFLGPEFPHEKRYFWLRGLPDSIKSPRNLFRGGGAENETYHTYLPAYLSILVNVCRVICCGHLVQIPVGRISELPHSSTDAKLGVGDRTCGLRRSALQTVEIKIGLARGGGDT
jgi:hypothetical protein